MIEFILPAPAMLLLHELTHVVAVKLLGGTVKAFRPYPHKHEGKWILGRVSYNVPTNNRWRHAAPLALNIPLTIAALLTVPALALWPALDFLAWMRGYLGIKLPWGQPLENLDGRKFRK